jgi:hypothetical protein
VLSLFVGIYRDRDRDRDRNRELELFDYDDIFLFFGSLVVPLCYVAKISSP